MSSIVHKTKTRLIALADDRESIVAIFDLSSIDGAKFAVTDAGTIQ